MAFKRGRHSLEDDARSGRHVTVATPGKVIFFPYRRSCNEKTLSPLGPTEYH